MDRNEASELIAAKFTRMMNATTSRYGLLSDVASASVLSGALLLVGLFLLHADDTGGRNLVLAVSVIPILASLVAAAAFRGARERVVDWLASLPFPLENLNAILAGTSDTVEVVFAPAASLPGRADLGPVLEKVSDQVLLLAERADEKVLEIKLGVIDSKRLPIITNHRRYQRLRELIEKVIVPLRREGAAIEQVRVV